MINFKTLNKEQLKDFIDSKEYQQMPVLPISRHRAISHIYNPRALKEDVLLILAYEENTLLGYLGVLPDDIRGNTHVGWLSCIWISPNARGKGIAKKLVGIAYDAYNHAIIITNYTKEAGNLYAKMGIFEPMAILFGKRFYRKMCLSKILPNRYPKTASIKLLLSFFDGFINFFWKLVLLAEKFNSKIMDMELSEIREWTADLNTYIEEVNESDFRRTGKEFNWIISFPWIIQTSTQSQESFRYYFSSEEKYFKTQAYVIRKNNRIAGILLFVLRNGHLKIPYSFYKPGDSVYMVKAIKHLAISNNASYITILSHQNLIDNLRFWKLYSKKILRTYLKTKEIKLNQPFVIVDGDGDAAFT
jgi:GNAT superfamily N-acetyltransferase